MTNPFDPNGYHSLSALVPDLGSEIDTTFPHIAEKIIALWGSSECMDYLEELLNYVPTSERPNSRQGFPFAVMTELSVIQNYHIIQYPETECSWKRRKDNPWK